MSDTPLAGAAGTPGAPYLSTILTAERDPQRLEQTFSSARHARELPQFMAGIESAYAAAPENLLYAAWHYRLHAQDEEGRAHTANWRLAVPFSIALGLAGWLISDPHWQMADRVPYFLLLGMPIIALFLIWFLTLAGPRQYLRAAILSLIVIAPPAYVLAAAPELFQGDPLHVFADPVHFFALNRAYLDLMIPHVALLSAAAVGIAVLGWASSARNRFAFLSKAIEAVGTAGVFAIALGIFATLTYGMFAALSIELPDAASRLLLGGGLGLIPVLAVASVYDPKRTPADQDFRRGFGRILAILMQALLPLTLVVLIVYVVVIPFNFMQPFTNRDVLIVYNVVLFAVMALLVGVTPLLASDYSARYGRWLRAGIIAVAALVLLVSLYALSAVLYRTFGNTLTMNRAVVIGWNVINIVLLAVLLVRQMRAERDGWVDAIHATARLGTTLYVVWGALVVLALPWLF